MGVQVGSSSGRGGRKEVDAELNLIPFIDLLSVCILFLLMTVVWVEISQMASFSQAGGDTVVQHSDVSNLRQEREDRDWDVFIRREFVVENGVNVPSDFIEIVQEGKNLGRYPIEQALVGILEQKSKIKDLTQAKISLRPADDVEYDSVIMVLDALYSAELKTVSVGGM